MCLLCPPDKTVRYHEAMYNNEPLIRLIADEEATPLSTARVRTPSSPCLPERLPNLAFLQREAKHNAPLAIIRQLRRTPSFPRAEEQPEDTSDDDRSAASMPNQTQPARRSTLKLLVQQTSAGWQPPQQFEIFRAIERKDITFL